MSVGLPALSLGLSTSSAATVGGTFAPSYNRGLRWDDPLLWLIAAGGVLALLFIKKGRL